MQRLEILRNLCEFHLEQIEHFWELLRVKDGETNWRTEPFGKDSKNRHYWVFSDGRMYREREGQVDKSKSRKSRANLNSDNLSLSWDIEKENNWELSWLSRSDYDEFLTSSFPVPIDSKDKHLLKIVREEIIPEVEPILAFQLSQHRKYFRPVASERILMLPRKRSSRILEKELEEEQRRAAQQEADREAEKEKQAMRLNLITAERADFASISKVEIDSAVEREQRAEMRRQKREKEMQIKAIEEAFYSNYNQSESESLKSDNLDLDLDFDLDLDNEINIEADSEQEIEEVVHEQAQQQTPKSPIKLVLKMMAKPVIEEFKPIDSTFVTDSAIFNTTDMTMTDHTSTCITNDSTITNDITAHANNDKTSDDTNDEGDAINNSSDIEIMESRSALDNFTD